MTRTLSLCILVTMIGCPLQAATPGLKPRVVVLTDMSNEPDDQMSLVRCLAYANEFDVEGLIATTSCWKRDNPDTDTIHRVIDAYGEARENLTRHASGYPTAEHLHRVTKRGVNGYGMEAATGQLDNEGVRHIVSVLERDDPRPVWFCAWGGGNTLGGAVLKLQRERPTEVAGLVAKIRGYEIALQDDGWAYVAHQFPGTKLISARLLWKGISRTTPGFSAWSESWGGNNEVFSDPWIVRNVQQNHGPLGAQYPDAVYLWEGDSPSFLYLIPNGLNVPDEPAYGGWGGRFEPQPQLNVRTGSGNDTVDGLLATHRDYRVYSDAKDAWAYGEVDYRNEYCTIFRWREDFQNDFAARMDWCVTDDYQKANHNPVAVLNGEASKRPLILVACPGEVVTLSSVGSHDPDQDVLTSHWVLYPEAGGGARLDGAMLSASRGTEVTLEIPALRGETPAERSLHVILSVRDDGSPPMTSYRRAVVTVSTGD